MAIWKSKWFKFKGRTCAIYQCVLPDKQVIRFSQKPKLRFSNFNSITHKISFILGKPWWMKTFRKLYTKYNAYYPWGFYRWIDDYWDFVPTEKIINKPWFPKTI